MRMKGKVNSYIEELIDKGKVLLFFDRPRQGGIEQQFRQSA